MCELMLIQGETFCVPALHADLSKTCWFENSKYDLNLNFLSYLKKLFCLGRRDHEPSPPWKLLLFLFLFDAIISANNYYYLNLRFAIADDESVLNSKDIKWSNENLLEMSSLEESIEPPRKVMQPDKVATIMISLNYYY